MKVKATITGSDLTEGILMGVMEQAKIALKMQLLLEVIFNEMKESNK